MYCICGKIVEGKTNSCASHNREQRKGFFVPKKKVAIRRTSAKRQQQINEYKKVRDQFLQGKSCARCGRKHDPPRFELSVHHKKGKIDELLTDVRWFLAVCVFPCHGFLESHPNISKAKGWSLDRLHAN